jgi:DNA-binding transcriptional LysR family regulator
MLEEMGLVRVTEQEGGRKVYELTDAGRVFLIDARNVLQLTEQASERAAQAGQGAAGRVDVALFGTAIFGAIPVMLRSYRRDHPGVNIVLHNMTKAEQLKALAQHRISLAFNRLMQPTHGVVSEALMTELLFVAVPSDHPLAARTAIRIAELEGEPLVLYPTGLRPSFIDRTRAMCAEAGFAPNVVAEVAEGVHGIALVATGGGLAFVPRSAINLDVPGVTYRPLHEMPRPGVDLCCIYREHDDSPVLAGLLESLRASAKLLAAEV